MLSTFVVAVLSFLWLIISKTAVIWAPLLIMYYAFEMWHHFVTDRFIVGMQWSVLEIQVPRDVEKTPMAMELIFTNALYHASQKGIWETWVVGAPHFWFSLEIAGIDGGVHFYIRTPSRIRDLVETQIYAQYPQAKVAEVEDYTLRVPYDAPNKDWMVWGCEFKLMKHDAYPIKTYRDYGLDKPSDKETLKIDPITPTIEFLGSLKRGQQVWIQHIIRPSKKVYHSHKTHAHQGWVEEANEEIERLLGPYGQAILQGIGPDGKNTGAQGIRYQGMSEIVNNRVKKIVEKTQKIGFDIGTRVVIVGDMKYTNEHEFGDIMRSSRLLFRQYANPDLNGFVRTNGTGYPSPWMDPSGRATYKKKNRMLNWYRVRIWYHPPFWYSFDLGLLNNILPFSHPLETNVLNVEELATIFHFPGQVSQAPSFRRVESRVAKPPANLPI